MEFLIHLKITVPRGINLVGISLTNESGPLAKKENVWRQLRPKEQQTDKNTFSRQQTISCMLFCETPDTDGELREACTMEIDSRVRSVAHELCDVNLISKVSTGDMVALGVKYHSSCLAACVQPRTTE